MKDQERHTHESYGQIDFSRINSNGQEFYGSELQQGNYIQMTVHESEHIKNLSSDYYYPTKRILQLRMSNNQFSEMITSMNYGSGVPCTLEIANGKVIEPIKKNESHKEFIHRKMKNRMTDFADRLKENTKRTKELVAKKTLSKADQQELKNMVEHMSTEITSNIPFFMETFQETMDDVVADAKTEIEGAIQHKVNVLGLEKLHEQNKLLLK